jgi:hypothetical protein
MVVTAPIYIAVHRGRLAGLLRLSLYFLFTGLVIASVLRFGHSFLLIIISGLGIVQILFSTPIAFFLFRRWIEKKPGIILDKTGITNNTIPFSTIPIPWHDIQEIKCTKENSLIIFVKDPTKYISRQSNFMKRRFMKMLFKTYGSPIVISSNNLIGNFAEFQNILQTEIRERKLQQGE